jgi:hypothetical protein
LELVVMISSETGVASSDENTLVGSMTVTVHLELLDSFLLAAVILSQSRSGRGVYSSHQMGKP